MSFEGGLKLLKLVEEDFELTAAILPEAEIAPATRPDWRKRFLDIILPTREAVMKDFREAEGEMGVYQGERRVMRMILVKCSWERRGSEASLSIRLISLEGGKFAEGAFLGEKGVARREGASERRDEIGRDTKVTFYHVIRGYDDRITLFGGCVPKPQPGCRHNFRRLSRLELVSVVTGTGNT
jgi:hypothetical protein